MLFTSHLGVVQDPGHAARARLVETVWPLAGLAAVANVIMQLGVRPVGHGVQESLVESGRLDKRPIKRGRTTFTYLAVAMLGAEEEREAYRRAVDKAHAQVNSRNVERVTGRKSPVEYNAFDPKLQLWVAMCLFKGSLDVMRLMSARPLTPQAEEEILRACAPLATTLQAPEAMWPATMAEFGELWARHEEQVRIDEPVRAMLDDIASMRFLPGMGLLFGWANRYFTSAFLPPKFRAEMRSGWGPARQGVFRVFVAASRTASSLMPRRVRMLPATAFLWDLRRRIKRNGPLVSTPRADAPGHLTPVGIGRWLYDGSVSTQYDAVIVGAGFGGMGAAIQLKELGLTNLLILDREDDLGGTWHVNHYPGLAVDIPSATYSYSFEPNPRWSRLFAPGAELKQYASHVADKYDLRRHMRFNTSVTGARWDGEDRHWAVASDSGETVTGKYLLAATGYLSQPKAPDIDGVETFAGKVLHTAKWDDGFRAEGRRIAVIGTGATGVQIMPELAKDAQQLTVYQRTPIWVVPKCDVKVPGAVKRLFARAPLTQKAVRAVGSAILEAIMVGGVLHFRQLKSLNRVAALLARAHLFAQVRDPRLRRELTPDYDFGCKRPTFSNTYFRAFAKKNVSLETARIERVEPDGIVTADGRKTTIDTLVLATGFSLWETNFPAFEIIGRDGRDLGKFWRDNRFQAFEGVTVPKFPNFLCLNSPYSYSGLSYFDTIESQMRHMKRLFGEMARTGADTFEVTEEANAEFLDRMTRNLDDSVFYLGSCQTARSYYFNQHGEAALLRPTSTAAAYKEQGSFPLEAYSLV